MTLKTTKVFYWIFTGIICLFMTFDGVLALMQPASAKMLMAQLGYPTYLLIILGVAKLVGVAGVLQTKYEALREWAYAGFVINIIGAIASILFAGLGFTSAIFAIVMLAITFASYYFWKKMIGSVGVHNSVKA